MGDLTGIKNRITNRDKKYNQKLHELPYEKISILFYKMSVTQVSVHQIHLVLKGSMLTNQTEYKEVFMFPKETFTMLMP